MCVLAHASLCVCVTLRLIGTLLTRQIVEQVMRCGKREKDYKVRRAGRWMRESERGQRGQQDGEMRGGAIDRGVNDGEIGMDVRTG